jgi:hypothetical protein
MRGAVKPLWLSEMVAVWGYVQRNYFLTKRYFMWEVVWLVYVTVHAATTRFGCRTGACSLIRARSIVALLARFTEGGLRG